MSTARRQTFYLVSEAADLLRCTRAAIYNYAARGELRLIKRGRNTLIPAVDIAAMLGVTVAELAA